MEILVNGVSVLAYAAESSVRISSTINSRSTASFMLRDTTGALDVAVGRSVQMYDAVATSVFGGTVEEVRKRILDDNTGVELQLSCVSHEQRLDKRVVQSKIYTDTNCGAVVADLITSFADGEGIFLDGPSTVQAGADVDQIIYDYDRRLSDVLDELASLSGFVWWVDPDGYLFFVSRTFDSAPWTLTNTDIQRGTANVTRSRSGVVNRLWQRVNWAAKAETYNFFTGDGSTRLFTLLDGSSQPNPVNRIERILLSVTTGASVGFTANAGTDTLNATGHPFVNGYQVRVQNTGGDLPDGLSSAQTYFVINKAADTFQVSHTSGGTAVAIDDAGTGTHFAFVAGGTREVSWGVDGTDEGKEYWWKPGSAVIRQDNAEVILTATDTLEVWYRALGDDVFMTDDAAAIAARAAIEGTGIYEHIADDQSAVLLHEAVVRAEAYVAAYKNTALTVEFQTVRAGLRPGQILPATVTVPAVSGNWLVESVGYVADLSAGENEFRCSVKIIDGSRIGGWLAFWEKLAGHLTHGAGISLGGSTENPAPPPDIDINIPPPLTSGGWSVAVAEYGAQLAGQPMARLRITVTERPDTCEYFGAWLFEGASPPSDPQLFTNEGNQPISESGDTYLDLWVEREAAAVIWQVAVTASNSHSFVVPNGATEVKPVTVTAAAASAAVTGFAVVVGTENAGGIGVGRYFVSFTPPADPEYFHTLIERIWCDASFVPVPGAEWLETFNLVDGNFEQSDTWPLPTNAEFWKFRARTVTRAGIIQSSGIPVVNVTVPASGGIVGVGIPEQITLGTPQQRYSLPDAQGKVYIEITCPVTAPDPLGHMDRVYYALQAPDDAGDKAEIGIDAGWTIPSNVTFTADAGTDTLTAAGHPFANGNYVRLRNVGGSVPAGLSASTFYYVVNKATNTLQLSLTSGGGAVNITGAGSGTNSIFIGEFSGVLPLNEPEESGVRMWVDAEGLIKVRHPAPPKAETWRLYGAAGSPSYTPQIIRADVAGATPNVAIEVGPPGARGLGEEWAPLGRGFIAKTDATYTAGVKYDYQDGGNILYGLGVSWTAPDLTMEPQTGGYDIAIRYSDGRMESSVTAISANDIPQWNSDQWPLQNEGSTFKLYLVTWDVNGRRNTIIDGVTPSASITVTRGALTSGIEYAPLATGFALRNIAPYTAGVRYTVSDGGQTMYGMSATWNLPDIVATPQLGGYDIVIEYTDGRRELTSSVSANDTPQWISDFWSLQADGAEFTIYLVSWDTALRRNSIVDGITPEIGITVSYQIGVSGQEYTANVSSLNVGTFTYPENGQGQRQAQVPVTVTKPADPRFGYWTLYASGPDFSHKQFSGPEYSTTIQLDFNGYPWTPENWTFYAVSHDTSGRANQNPVASVYVTGTYETVSVGPPPAGSAGVEFTSLIGNPVSGAMFDYQTRVTQEGVEEWRAFCRWSNPSDVTFGGAKIILKKTFPVGQEEFFPGEYAGPIEVQFGTKWRTIVDGERFVVYILSIDVNNKENNIVEGLTPKSGEIVTTANPTGQLKGYRLNPLSVASHMSVSGVLGVAPQGITEALVSNFAITESKLASLPIINDFQVKTAAITNLKLDRASANKIAIVSADVVSLAANTILAGTISVALSLTAASINATTGAKTVRLNFGTDLIAVYDTVTFSQARLTGNEMTVQATSGSNANSVVVSTSTGVTVTGFPGNGCVAALNASTTTAAVSLLRTAGTGRSVQIFTSDQTTGPFTLNPTSTGGLTVRIDGVTRIIPYY